MNKFNIENYLKNNPKTFYSPYCNFFNSWFNRNFPNENVSINSLWRFNNFDKRILKDNLVEKFLIEKFNKKNYTLNEENVLNLRNKNYWSNDLENNYLFKNHLLENLKNSFNNNLINVKNEHSFVYIVRNFFLNNGIHTEKRLGVSGLFKGIPDVWGILPNGMHFELEFKTEEGFINPLQLIHLDNLYKYYAIHSHLVKPSNLTKVLGCIFTYNFNFQECYTHKKIIDYKTINKDFLKEIDDLIINENLLNEDLNLYNLKYFQNNSKLKTTKGKIVKKIKDFCFENNVYVFIRSESVNSENQKFKVLENDGFLVINGIHYEFDLIYNGNRLFKTKDKINHKNYLRLTLKNFQFLIKNIIFQNQGLVKF